MYLPTILILISQKNINIDINIHVGQNPNFHKTTSPDTNHIDLLTYSQSLKCIWLFNSTHFPIAHSFLYFLPEIPVNSLAPACRKLGRPPATTRQRYGWCLQSRSCTPNLDSFWHSFRVVFLSYVPWAGFPFLLVLLFIAPATPEISLPTAVLFYSPRCEKASAVMLVSHAVKLPWLAFTQKLKGRPLIRRCNFVSKFQAHCWEKRVT